MEDLKELLSHEECIQCGSIGFELTGQVEDFKPSTITYPGNWVSHVAACKTCGLKIEKRRFES